MAKKFAGFKPETMEKKILPALGYNGPNNQKSINAFLAANPAAAAKMGKYTMAARQMVEGKPIQAAKGSYTPQEWAALPKGSPEKTVANYNAMRRDSGMLGDSDDPYKNNLSLRDSVPVGSGSKSGSNMGTNQAAAVQASNGTVAGEPAEKLGTSGDIIKGSDVTEQILEDPTKNVTRPTVVKPDDATVQSNLIDATDPSLQIGAGTGVQAAQAAGAADIQTPANYTVAQGQAIESVGDVKSEAKNFQGQQGQVSKEGTYEAATVDPTQSAVLGLDVAQGQAAQVDAPDPLKVTQDQLIDGSAVDQQQIEETLAKTEAATVSGEMASLMKDFDQGQTPPWAAGAMRKANAAMAARGLSASSMAGMAVVQAAMEAALPIAKLDAANKQQMALAKAEQRANFLGIEFDQEFQTKVKNTARISEVANLNFNAEQTIALENARLTNTMDIANLDAKSAKTVADTAALASLERANLSAINQAAADNAQAFLDMDFKNLDNAQEAEKTKFQETANAIMKDANAKNVMEQINVQEQNAAEEFMLELGVTIAKANQDQTNAMERFNVGEENVMAQFNEEEKRKREEFNVENRRLIEQSNATYKQQVTTDETAAINAAYELEAKAANTLSKEAYNNLVNEEKDMMYYAFTGEQNELDRVNKLSTANINSGSGGALEKGFADMASEVVTSWITSKFPAK